MIGIVDHIKIAVIVCLAVIPMREVGAACPVIEFERMVEEPLSDRQFIGRVARPCRGPDTKPLGHRVRSHFYLTAEAPNGKAVMDRHADGAKNRNNGENSAEALLWAARRGDRQAVKELLAQGASPRAEDEAGVTPLHWAASRGYRRIAKALLEAGANVNARSEGGFTPLHWAADGDDPKMIKILVDAGAKLDARTQLRWTPLHWASSRTVIEALVKAGADVDAQDLAKMTPLHLRASHWNEEAFKALIDAGANPNIKDGSGCTVLHEIAGSGDLEAITLLLATGADVNARNDAWRTPLHFARGGAEGRMIRAFLDAGADVHAKDMAGMTPLHIAARRGDVNKIKALVAAGADVNARDKRGLTALEWAAAHGRREAVQLLRKIHQTRRSRAEASSDVSRPKQAGTGVLATKAIDVFGLNLYSRLDAGENNLVFSPLSVFSALATALTGAREETRDEMRQTIGLNGLDVPLPVTLGRLNRNLSSPISNEGGALYMANGLWVHKFRDYAIRKEVGEILATHYDSAIRQADFRKSPEKVSQEISSWVERATRGRISGVVSARELGLSESVLLIVNAVYFKSMWAIPFKKEETSEARFTALDGPTIMVPMMHNLDGNYRYMETQTFQAVELPYKGQDLSMVVFLPKDPGGLVQFEESLTVDKLLAWLGELLRWPYGVEVYLPRFVLRCRFKLRAALEAVGMKKAFVPGEADFAGFLDKTRTKAPDIRLFISSAVHEAWIEVNEEGTEAAAATIFGFSIGVDERPKVFRADHPFMFVIYHKPTNCILFMGRVVRPEPPRSDDRSSTR